MKRSLDLSETSDYPKDHFLYSPENKKVVCKMKDECAGVAIKEVVCLRSKMYSIKLEDGKTVKKAKGTTKGTTKAVTRAKTRAWAHHTGSKGWVRPA